MKDEMSQERATIREWSNPRWTGQPYLERDDEAWGSGRLYVVT